MRLWAFASGAAFVCGCGTSGGSSAADGGATDSDLVAPWSPTVTDADCATFADELASGVDACGVVLDTTPQDFRARLALRCKLLANARGSGVTVASLHSCAQTLAQRCEPYAECPTVAGSLRDGAACGDGSQCASGACSNFDPRRWTSTAACGTCVFAPVGPCIAHCPIGTWCDDNSSGGRYLQCIPWGGDKDTCSYAADRSPTQSYPCRYGFHCGGTPMITSSTETFACVGGIVYVAPPDPNACR